MPPCGFLHMIIYKRMNSSSLIASVLGTLRKQEKRRYSLVRSESEASGILEIEPWETRIGTVALSARWAFQAELFDIDPIALDTFGRDAYYNKDMRSEELFSAMMDRFGVEREIPRLWMETLHAKHICTEVIERDCYGVTALKAVRFVPKVIVDVGAHVGTFSMLAKRAWPNAHLFAMEPRSDFSSDPNNLHHLRHNMKGIPDVTIIHNALIGFFGKEDNDERMNELAGETFKHWVELGLRGHPKHREKTDKGGHEGMSVSSFLDTYGIKHIDLLKLDCEGAETNVLRECAELGFLQSIEMIRGEWHGELAKKELPGILSQTHKIRMENTESPAGRFYASRK